MIVTCAVAAFALLVVIAMWGDCGYVEEQKDLDPQ